MEQHPADAPERKCCVQSIVSAVIDKYHKILRYEFLSDCPGTQSESAGKVSACAGCPNQSICASGAANTPDPGK